MKIRYLFLLIILILFSCSPTPGENKVASGDLQIIPDFKPEIPDSLGGNELKNDLKLKSIGDINSFSQDYLQDIKSEGWKNFCDAISKENWATFYLNALKVLLSINTNFPYNTNIYIGTPTISINNKNTNVNFGSIYIKKISDYYKEIFWTIPLSHKGNLITYNFNLYIFITISNIINNNYKITMQAKSDLNTIVAALLGINPNKFIIYGSYDSSQNEIIEFFKLNDSTFFFNKSKKESGGIYIYSQNMVLGILTNKIIAWGDSTKGGLIANSKSLLGDYIHTECYKSGGSLIYKNYGANKIPDFYTSVWNLLSILGQNIKNYGFTNAIDKLTFSVVGTTSLKYIFTNGYGSISTNDQFYYLFYYKNSSSWNSGDAFYFLKDINKISNGLSYFNYVRADKIPDPVNYFEGNYYIQNHWPLKYLVLDDEYSNYQLVNKIKQTHTFTYTWSDINDTNIIYTNTFEWNDYEWWLDKDKDNILSNFIDIQIRNIYEDDAWIWDKTNWRKPTKQKSWFIKSSETKPLYFKFTQQELVNDVTYKLTNYYETEIKSFTIDNFVQSIPAFPSLSQFPSPTNNGKMYELK